MDSKLKTQNSKLTIVIGYGNDLRGDDAVGPRAAQAVAAWDVPGVCGLAVHQLTPELAEVLAAAALAIFVDARVPNVLFPRELGNGGREIVEARPVEPAAVDSAVGHTGDPRALLALTKALYGCCPVAWSITVPAHSFAFGAGLSLAAERGLTAALRRIGQLIKRS